MKKLMTMFTLITLFAVLSCSDNELVSPAKKTESVAPPPANRTVTVDARMSGSTSTPVGLYYMSPFPTATWTYLATLTGTNCQQGIASFSIADGSTVYFMVWDGSYNIAYHARAGTCASKSNPYYCGEQSSGPDMYNITVNGANVTVGMHVLVNTVTNEPMICAF